VSRIAGGGALATTAIVAAVFVHLVGFARLGWGPKLALAGAIVLMASTRLPRTLRV
jgi:hypothetical protein